MIGKLKYYDDSDIHIKNGRLEDFLLEYYIGNLASNRSFEGHVIVKYSNSVNGRTLKLQLRKAEQGWFDFYYTGLVESKVTISSLSDLKTVYEVYNGFLEEIKTLEDKTYQKLKEDVKKVKSSSNKLNSEENYSESTHGIICTLFNYSCKLAQAMKFDSQEEIFLPLGSKKIYVEPMSDGDGDTLVLKIPQKNASVRELRFYLDENENIVFESS